MADETNSDLRIENEILESKQNLNTKQNDFELLQMQLKQLLISNTKMKKEILEIKQKGKTKEVMLKLDLNRTKKEKNGLLNKLNETIKLNEINREYNNKLDNEISNNENKSRDNKTPLEQNINEIVNGLEIEIPTNKSRDNETPVTQNINYKTNSSNIKNKPMQSSSILVQSFKRQEDNTHTSNFDPSLMRNKRSNKNQIKINTANSIKNGNKSPGRPISKNSLRLIHSPNIKLNFNGQGASIGYKRSYKKVRKKYIT